MIFAQEAKIELFLFTNPQELRQIADEMEKKIQTAQLGDTYTIKRIPLDQGNIRDRINLNITWDQDK